MDYRYLKTRQVNEALWGEIHHPPVNFIVMDMLAEMHQVIKKVRKDDSIRENILTLDYENATTDDIVGLLNNTLDVMEQAKIFSKFQGK